MVPLFMFSVDIVATNKTIDEKEFRAQVEPHLSHLEALKGAFSPTPCSINYYRPSDEHEKFEAHALRVVVSVSVGKARREHLRVLCGSIFSLLCYELPDFRIEAQAGEWKFS